MIVRDVKIHYGVFDESIIEDERTESASSSSAFVQSIDSLLTVENRDKLAWLEKDYFLLDGRHLFPEEGKKYNIGWESNNLSNATGVLDEYIQFNFTQVHSSFGILIYFAENSEARDFTIDYYKNDTLVKSHSVTDNTASKVTVLDIIEEWNKVKITITKTAVQQRARIMSISFGIGSDLDKNSIINASASSVTDISTDTFECGSFSFQFFNDGGVFAIQDIRDMPLALQESIMATIFVKFNNSASFVTFGKYNSTEIKIEEKGTVVTIAGYDELYNLNNTVYKKGIVYPEGRSLKAWAEEVAADADVDIVVDNSFANIMSTGYITEVPHREAFRLIAEAGNGYLWIDSDSVIHISKYAEKNVPDLTEDEVVQDTLNIDSADRYFGVQVSRYAFSPTKELVSGGLGYLEEVSLTPETQELEIVYSQYPAVVSTVEVRINPTSSAVLSNVRIYSDRCVFDLSGTAGDTTWVTVTGKAYNQAIITDSAGSLLKSYKKIENNFLITGSLGQAVATYQNNIVSNRYAYSAEVVSDSVINLADRVKVDNNPVIIENINLNVEYGDQTVSIEGTSDDK